jgi:hypothetical protein
MPERRTDPYIWVTWLSKLLVGDNSCEWASWFRAHFRDFQKVPSDFDTFSWQIDHTDLLNEVRVDLEAEGHTVTTEQQNLFRLRGSSGITVGGRPDLIAVSGESGAIFEVKTGEPRAADAAQVLIYMFAVPLAFPQYRQVEFRGEVAYRDHRVPVPSTAMDDAFKTGLVEIIRRVGAEAPTRKVPSAAECRFCDITSEDCPERIAADAVAEGPVPDF